MSRSANPAVTCLPPQFHDFIAGLIAVLGVHAAAHRECGPVLYLLYRRLLRWRREFAALAGRVAAGTLRNPRSGSGPALRRAKPRHAAATAASPPPLQLPREFGWLVRLVGWRSAAYSGYLRQFLARPEMREFLAAAPQAAAIFRPLCRMLHVDPAEFFPPRPRQRRAASRRDAAHVGSVAHPAGSAGSVADRDGPARPDDLDHPSGAALPAVLDTAVPDAAVPRLRPAPDAAMLDARPAPLLTMHSAPDRDDRLFNSA